MYTLTGPVSVHWLVLVPVLPPVQVHDTVDVLLIAFWVADQLTIINDGHSVDVY